MSSGCGCISAEVTGNARGSMPCHFAVGMVLLIALASFGTLLIKSFSHANDKIGPRLIEMEKSGPK
jgi:hypothetical protein